MKERFCKDVLNFLKSEYNDAYEFTIELKQGQFYDTIELKIKLGDFMRIIIDSYMNYFYELYRHGDFIADRNQFVWQKELIDLIEGG